MSDNKKKLLMIGKGRSMEFVAKTVAEMSGSRNLDLIEKARQEAKEEVEKRIVTKEEAKKQYKEWIQQALEKYSKSLTQDVVDYWVEVFNQVDDV